MLNKKGFTIAEVIVSFGLVSAILASMVGTTIYYRDKMKQEEVVTQLVDFKNSITNEIYDDILASNNRKIVKIEKCANNANCVNFIDKANNTHRLEIIEYDTTTNEHKKGVYLSYDNRLHMLPDSDLGNEGSRICDFIGGFDLSRYEDVNNHIMLYTVKTTFKNWNLDKDYTIMVTVTHYNGS